MLRKIVIIILALTNRLTICAAVHAQITTYDDIQYEKNFDQSPFMKIGDSYYIIETTEKLNWFSATLKCCREGGNLASIESKAELLALTAYFKTIFEFQEFLWISGNDLNEENHFQWLGTGQSMEYTSWRYDEPDKNHDNKDCVYLSWGLPVFDFVTWNCYNKLKYICEADYPKQISITLW